jgi:transcriptional regulator of nitric oxide reductase
MVLAAGAPGANAQNVQILDIYPGLRSAAEELPETARRYLQQAYETLHAPDAAAVMAGSAVDAMLKAKGYVEGSLYARVDQAVADHMLTKEMGDWAHWVRLGSNRPRHADKGYPPCNAA